MSEEISQQQQNLNRATAARKLYESKPVLFPYKAKTKIISRPQLEMIIPSFKKTDQSGKVDFKNIFRIFTDKHAKRLYSRQLDVLNKVIAIYHNGVPMNDITSFAELLRLVNTAICSGTALIPQAAELVRLLRTYPVLDTDAPLQLSEIGCKELESILDDTKTLLSNIADLIGSIDDDEFIHYATEAIYKISGGTPRHTPDARTVRIKFKTSGLSTEIGPIINEIEDEEESINSKLFLQAAEKSDCALKLVEVLNSARSEAFQFGIFKCLRRFSKLAGISKRLGQEKHLEIMFKVLSENYEKDTIVFPCMDILWNIMDNEQIADQAVQYLLKRNVLHTLKNLVEQSCRNPATLVDRQRRNEFAGLCKRVADLANPTYLSVFHDVGFTELLFDLLTAKKKNTKTHRRDLTNCPEDFAFKRNIISCAKTMLQESKCCKYLIQSGILTYCKIMIGGHKENLIYSVWNISQLQCLQLLVVGLMTVLIPKTAKEFRAIHGPTHIMNFLAELIQNGIIIDKKRVDLVRNHVALLRATLLCVLTIAESGPNSKKILGQLNVFKHLLKILETKDQDPLIWQQSLLICSSLCQGYKANRQIFGDSGGVKIVAPFLLFNSSDPKEHEMIALATLECIWGSITGNIFYEELFINQQGIFHMLDMMETGTYKIKGHGLGCLLDLLENPNAIAHTLFWRTKKDCNRGVGHLLVSIWNSEEQRLGVVHGKWGEIGKTENFPLKGMNYVPPTIAEVSQETGRHENHPSIKELGENLKAKIYSFFCKIGIENLAGTITPDEKVKIALISKYLDFKVAEVWNEITEEFKVDGIRPVSPDQDCINCVAMVAKKKRYNVCEAQLDIIRSNEQKSKSEENVFFEAWIKEFAPDPAPAQKPRLHKWRQSLWTESQ